MSQNIAEALRAVHRYAKEKKLISQGLRLLPGTTPQAAAKFAEQLGYGKKKRKAKKKPAMVGGSWLTDIGDSIGAIASGVGGGLGKILRGNGKKKQRGGRFIDETMMSLNPGFVSFNGAGSGARHNTRARV